MRLVNLLKAYGIDLGIQLMLGFPGSTFETDYLTALKAVEIATRWLEYTQL